MKNCLTCRHSLLLPNDSTKVVCRRYPPIIVALPQQTIQGVQLVPTAVRVVIPADETCGEYDESAEKSIITQ